MREIGRHRRLRGRAAIAAAAVVTLAVGGATLVTTTSALASSSNGQCNSSPTITVEPFGSPVADVPYSTTPEQTFRYTLTNCRGMQIRLLTYGAITQSITVPDQHGNMADVALGFATLSDYVNFVSPPPTSPNFGGPYFGETIGRYGNRIAKGTFKLNNTTYTLPINNGVNSLHGGFVGFGNHIWHATGTTATSSSVSVTLKLVSPNGDEGSGLLPGTKVYEPNCSIPANPPTKCTGYPAQLTVWVTFSLDNHNRYWIHYKAQNNDKSLSTVLNLTNHTYFNLAGEASGSALSQLVQINADTFTPTNTVQIPTGAITPVSDAPQFDFTQFKPIFPSISDCTGGPTSLGCAQLLIAHGFDHNWVLNAQTPATTGPAGLNLAARALDPVSGRELTVWTDQPGVQFYTSNFLTGSLVGISGHTYRQGQAYTFETQHFPNSPNQPNFPSTVLKAGQTFNSTTIFAFSS
ncbi:MAG: galactose mutarotase [Candidatus Dormibacteraeota bacterium]|nr:galactose mutarotase [Candidatus Dormibacteraeota bacterium]